MRIVAMCVIAPNAQLLIAFRILQGIGSGALVPVAMAIIFRLFGPRERAGAMVLLMVPLLLGPAFGPTLGGYLATNFTWNAIFTINLPIGVVAFILALLVLRGNAAEREANGSDQPGAQGFDLLGLALSMAGFSAFVYSITRAGINGWTQVSQHAQALQACVAQHAVTMGLNDTFLFALIGCAICAVPALFLGRGPISVHFRLMADRPCKGDRKGTPTRARQEGTALSSLHFVQGKL